MKLKVMGLSVILLSVSVLGWLSVLGLIHHNTVKKEQIAVIEIINNAIIGFETCAQEIEVDAFHNLQLLRGCYSKSRALWNSLTAATGIVKKTRSDSEETKAIDPRDAKIILCNKHDIITECQVKINSAMSVCQNNMKSNSLNAMIVFLEFNLEEWLYAHRAKQEACSEFARSVNEYLVAYIHRPWYVRYNPF